ncbi:hypothetical protein [Aurantivibrio infirmus]
MKRTFLILIVLPLISCVFTPDIYRANSISEVSGCEKIEWFSVFANTEEMALKKAMRMAHKQGANTIYSPDGILIALHSSYSLELYLQSYKCKKT